MTRKSYWLLALLLATPLLAQTPAPLPSGRITLPLTDGTTTQAAFLAAPDGRLHLVYSTPTGTLVLFDVIPESNPVPPPPPPPPPPPVSGWQFAIVENPATSTPAQRAVMSATSWREKIKPPNVFAGIIPSGLVDPSTGQPPPHLKPFLTAASKHALPVCVLLDSHSNTVLLTELPGSVSDLEHLLNLERNPHHATTRNRQLERGRTGQALLQTDRAERKHQKPRVPPTLVRVRPLCRGNSCH